MKSWRELAGELAVMVAIAALLAVLGPFGTFALPLGLRFADWLLFAIGGYCCFRPVIAGGSALAATTALPLWLALAIACVIAALPTTLIVAFVFAGSRWRELQIGDLAGLYPQVVIIGGLATAIQLFAQRRRRTPLQHFAGEGDRPPQVDGGGAISPQPSLSPPAPSPPFLDRLPAHLGRDLLYLENEDHYVRAYTPQGSTLILIRMRDAVAELDGIEGARVHRSWWVARAAVAGIERRDRAIALKLSDGREVPVARTTAPELRAAGWW